MPKFNGTGPWGQGPGTGWGMGPCACPPVAFAPGDGRRGAGIGWRRGFGRGFGRFWKFGSQISKKEEKEVLEEEAEILENDLKEIKARLSELKGQK